MVEVAAHLDTKLPAMSQIVDRLVKRGMVERRSDPSDRRAVRLFLTDSARIIMAEADCVREARMIATTARLSEKSLAAVVRGLEMLAEAAEYVEALERSGSPRVVEETDTLMELITQRGRRRPIPPNQVSPDHVKSGQKKEGERPKPNGTATV